MIKLFFLRKLVARHRNLIFQEGRQMQDFLKLLMKPRNTDVKWTKEEIRQLKAHLKRLSFYIPALVIFLLPFGAMLLPVLAELLDRRKKRRRI